MLFLNKSGYLEITSRDRIPVFLQTGAGRFPLNISWVADRNSVWVSINMTLFQ